MVTYLHRIIDLGIKNIPLPAVCMTGNQKGGVFAPYWDGASKVCDFVRLHPLPFIIT